MSKDILQDGPVHRGWINETITHWKEGRGILLGGSYYTPKDKIGHDDDRHCLTIAATGGGKGRSVIIPNLLEWRGSALVIDPKGTNAAVTAGRRGKGKDTLPGSRVTETLGQAVHILDPFGVVPDAPRACYNPLDEIDPNAPQAVETISLVADALIVRESGPGESHWDASAAMIAQGLIAHVLTHPAYEAQRHLGTVRTMIEAQGVDQDALLEELLANDSCRGLPRAAGSLLETAGPNERGSMLTTLRRNMAFLQSPLIEASLQRSDFSLKTLSRAPTTIYLVLPPYVIEQQKRWLRLFVNMAIAMMGGAGGAQDQEMVAVDAEEYKILVAAAVEEMAKSWVDKIKLWYMGPEAFYEMSATPKKLPVLFLLDEFYSLGALQPVAKAAPLMRSYGLKLWPIIQNVSQIQELYPHNWEGFAANAGFVQVFSINDSATAKYVSERLGNHSTWQESIGPGGRSFGRAVLPLRTPEEVMRDTGRDRQRMLVFRAGADPLALRMLAYDEAFKRNMYDPDPDHE